MRLPRSLEEIDAFKAQPEGWLSCLKSRLGRMRPFRALMYLFGFVLIAGALPIGAVPFLKMAPVWTGGQFRGLHAACQASPAVPKGVLLQGGNRAARPCGP